ncbi:hypothetical protein POM88_053039 [Heracleum sosnowskyi]|uniref:Uncharacterized protein n=1 Tax=Heracleum sosnowskyi TaxID=360622 RepID=A0AAD8LY16_9APIA|nr:hypothetical protein POM88_053039 [Heracleum sosnowskyi]
MAKNQHSKKSFGECEEVYIAISWPAHNLMSSGPAPAPSQTLSVSATTSRAFRLKEAARQLSSSGEVIPIEIHPHLLPTLQNFNKKTANHSGSFQKSTAELTKVSSKIKQEVAPTHAPVQHYTELSTQENMNDKFTAYINRVKHRMLTTLSNVGNAEMSPGNENFNTVQINDNSSAHVKLIK